MNFLKPCRSILGFCLILTVLLTSCQAPGIPPTPTAKATAVTPTLSPTPRPTPTFTPTPSFPKQVVPQDSLKSLSGNLATSERCPEALKDMPGGVILGMDPLTCAAFKTGEQISELEIAILGGYIGNVMTVKISWPDSGGKGLRSTGPDQIARAAFDGETIWQKKAGVKEQDAPSYYAARRQPVLFTFVPRQDGLHRVSLALPAGMLWDIGAITVTASPYPSRIVGMAYSPYRDCQSASTPSQPTLKQIQEDLTQLRHSATAIRTYSATAADEQVVKLAGTLNIPVYAGAFLDGDPAEDKRQMEGLSSIARANRIQAAVVGNEYYLRHHNEKNAPAYLLSQIQAFKKQFPQLPVATAEVDSEVFDWKDGNTPVINPAYRPVLDAVDVLLVHIYPFWQNLPVDGAAQATVTRFKAMQQLLAQTYGGKKRLMIGEAGWPSTGSPEGPGSVSAPAGAGRQSALDHPQQQRQYLVELLALAEAERIDLFYFDAFDELWKEEGYGGVGRSWGVQFSDRTAKYDFSSLLIPGRSLPDSKKADLFASSRFTEYQPQTWVLPVYTEWPYEPLHAVEPKEKTKQFSAALMGDLKNVQLNQCARASRSGDTAMEITYTPGGSRGWSGIEWLYPKDNWGISGAGLPLTQANALSFWARGKDGGEVAEFILGGICGDQLPYPKCPDSIQPKLNSGKIRLEKQWKNYTFNLSQVNRANIVGGFGVAFSQVNNPRGATIYLDDIVYTSAPPPTSAETFPRPMGKRFAVYTDVDALDNHYIPSNFMGDAASGLLTLNQAWASTPHSGKTAIKIDYKTGPQTWGGVYWTDPEFNWGERPGGYNLAGVRRLTFWARADAPQPVEFLVGGIGCPPEKPPYPDSACGKISYTIPVAKEWKQFTLDLTGVRRDWSRLLGGFGLVMRTSGTLYLDDIVYEFD